MNAASQCTPSFLLGVGWQATPFQLAASAPNEEKTDGIITLSVPTLPAQEAQFLLRASPAPDGNSRMCVVGGVGGGDLQRKIMALQKAGTFSCLGSATCQLY